MADGVRITSNASALAGLFARGASEFSASGVALVQHYGIVLQARVKANAAGRPGPRMVTGDYNRSIALDVTAGVQPTARVGTNRPQGRRLEFGFRGVDSLGRRYNQPPYAHFGPAFDQVAPQFYLAVGQLVERLVR